MQQRKVDLVIKLQIVGHFFYPIWLIFVQNVFKINGNSILKTEIFHVSQTVQCRVNHWPWIKPMYFNTQYQASYVSLIRGLQNVIVTLKSQTVKDLKYLVLEHFDFDWLHLMHELNKFYIIFIFILLWKSLFRATIHLNSQLTC